MFVVITSLILLKMLGILRLPGEFFFSEILPGCSRATWQENTRLSPRIFPSAGVSTTQDTDPLVSFRPSRTIHFLFFKRKSQEKPNVPLFSSLDSDQPIEIEERPPEVKIQKDADSIHQQFANEAMLEMPEIMDMNAGDRKALGQLRPRGFDPRA